MTGIGQKIKTLRKKADLTQEGLAELLGVSAQAVSKWEVGQASPDLALIAPLCRVFGVTADELLGIGHKTQVLRRSMTNAAKDFFLGEESFTDGKLTGKAAMLKASFGFFGDALDFDKLRRHLDCNPAYYRKKEEFPEISQKMGIAADEWVVSTCYRESACAGEVIGALLDMLEGKEAEILALKEESGAKTRMVLSVQTHLTPDLRVPLRCIAFLHTTETELDFDPYFYSE